jgi:outer membrane protein assembly factor BamB
MHRRRFCAAAVLIAGFATVCVADWTSFRGPNFNGITDEKVAWPSGGPRQLWKVPCGEGFGTMAVANGKVFVTAEGGGQEALLALDAKDGSAKWHYVIGRTIYERQGGNGPRTTPAVDGKLVFAYGTFLNLVCCDAESGKFLWGHEVAKEFGGDPELSANDIKSWGNAASPVFDDKCVFVYGGGNGQSFIAFDKQSGNVVWKTGNEHLTHSSPTIATIHGVRQIIFLTKSGLVSLATADGKELWRFPFKFNISTASSPVVSGKDGDVVYCTAGYKVGAAAARIIKDGERFTATQIWRNDDAQLLAQHWSSSVYKDGYLYGIFGWARPGDAPLKCVELESGKVMWEKPGFGFGGTILAGDTLVVQGSTGQVAFVKPTPQGYQAVGGGNVFQNAKCWNAAVVSNGRLYARTTKGQNSRESGSIICLDVSTR